MRIYEDEDSLVLSVQDISRGIDQETLEKLQQQLGTAAHPDHRDSGYGSTMSMSASISSLEAATV